MKTFVSIIVTIAIVTIFVFSNIILVTTGSIMRNTGNKTIIDAEGQFFELIDRPDLHNVSDIIVIFYTPAEDPETWIIIEAEPMNNFWSTIINLFK